MRYLLLCLMLVGCTPVVSPKKVESTFGRITNEYKKPIRWTKTPIILEVHKDFPEKYMPALKRAIAVWNFDKELLVLSPYSTSVEFGNDGYSVIYYVTKNWRYFKETQAMTTSFYVSYVISNADIELNAVNTVFYTDRPSKFEEISMESTLIHEIGHVLGLAHRGTDLDVMNPRLGYSYEQLQISDQDKRIVREIYGQ